MHRPSSLTDNRRGILFMLTAMAAFIVNDTFVKLVSAELPAGEIIFIRGLMAAPLLAALGWSQGSLGGLRGLRHRAVAWRSVGDMGATTLYLTALFHMPIANATAILQTVPLATTGGAALLFGEPVGIRRWSAIAVGFLGVLLIVRPGPEGFDLWALVALASVGFVCLRDLSSRLIPAGTPTFGVTAVAAAAVALAGAAMGLFEDWLAPSPAQIAWLAAAAVLVATGYVMILKAMRVGEVSVVAPFRYSLMLWAILIQVGVFGEWPDATTLAGSAILVATGLYTLYRERKVARRPIAAAIEPLPPGDRR